jgi:BirA family transcriptional regulator, biotin operon repressor / biotin---[acetyl-CoA-carboxylase] ligase
MEQEMLANKLADLRLGDIRYYKSIGSTNDQAARLIEEGAPDMALVVADQQTAGRGRMGRTWHTPAEAALAFSLVLFPKHDDPYVLPRHTALGALAVGDALHGLYGLMPKIKWPNDVLLERRKVSGVLVEAQWRGGELAALVMGIGINVAPASVLKDSQLRFPATCVEEVLGRKVDRIELLHEVLGKILEWRPRLSTQVFLQSWEERLAFRGEWVQVFPGQSPGKDGLPHDLEGLPAPIYEGEIIGLAPDGSLRLRTRSGEAVIIHVGEVRLGPVG